MLDMVEGRRGRDRPCMCWMGGVNAATKLSLSELWKAVDEMYPFRDVWRNLIMNVLSPEVSHDLTVRDNWRYNFNIISK